MTSLGNRVAKKTAKKKPAKKRVAKKKPAEPSASTISVDLGDGRHKASYVAERLGNASDAFNDLLKQHEAVATASQQQKEKEIVRRHFVTQENPGDALANVYWKLRGYGIPVKFDGATLSAVDLTLDEAKVFVDTASSLAPGGVLSRHTFPNGTSRVELHVSHLKAVADWNKAKADAEAASDPIVMDVKKYSSSVKFPEELLQSNRDLEKSLRELGAQITSNESVAGLPGIHKFESGAVRSTEADGARYDLISPIALRKLAETCHEGAIKYNEKGQPPNWLKGMPMSDVMNHLLTHIYKWISGDTSEPHLPHAFWNLMALIHFEETRPDLMDVYPRKTALEAKDTEAMPRGC